MTKLLKISGLFLKGDIVSIYNEMFESSTDDWWPLDPDWLKRFDPDWFNEDFEEDPYLKKRNRHDKEEPDDYEPYIPLEPSEGDYGP